MFQLYMIMLVSLLSANKKKTVLQRTHSTKAWVIKERKNFNLSNSFQAVV